MSVDADAVRGLYEHLSATAELPVSREASHHLGEAEAVAADAVAAAEGGAPERVVSRRLDQVADLLAAVDGTGNPTADEHVDAARERLAELREG